MTTVEHDDRPVRPAAQLGSYLLEARGREWIAGALGERDPYALLLRGHGEDEADLVRRAHERGPVFRSATDDWVVCGFDAAAQALADPRLGLWYADPEHGRGSPYPLERPLLSHVMALDRAGLCLSRAEQEQLRAATAPEPADHLDLISRSCRAVLVALPERFDLVADVARPFASAVLAGLLGVPADRLARFAELAADTAPALDAMVCAQRYPVARRLQAAVEELRSWWPDPVRGAGAVLFTVAGAGLVTDLLVNVVSAGVADPRDWAALADGPAAVTALVTETLRWDPPIRMEHRVAAERLTVAGSSIARGDRVVVLTVAAHRDPSCYPGPDSCEPGRFRTDRQPAAGSPALPQPLFAPPGSPAAPVAPVARLAAETMVGALRARFPELRRAGTSAPLRRLRSPVSRAVLELPVSAS